ncbi:MAG: glycosyltransferase family 4 protein [Cyanobacteria bacterium K_DeepCast_35m_m1_288]|nr:glycosyltransferase family 4 protein [Cyanobacteria bacterium K_DeepCast_35m_m1_288]
MPDQAAALLLPGDAFDTDQHQVMGRRVAGRSLAMALASHLQPNEELRLIALEQGERQRLGQMLQPLLPVGSRLAISASLSPQELCRFGCLHLPEPGLGRWSQLRSGLPAHAFSFSGIIHTLCSAGVVDALGQLLTSHLYSWDALICSSMAGRQVVEAALQSQHESLQERFGVALPRPEGPQLPLIPLAIDPSPLRWQEHFASRQAQRLWARQKLGLPANAVVVLFVGRLSFHSKAHPEVLYRALTAVARRASQPILLVECGHFYNQEIAAAWGKLAHDHPALHVHRLGGLEPATDEQKNWALAAADLFCSPADNLQETFGLTLLEAMAAELPVVASDWNGYRDLVEHGSSGFLIPTADPLVNADPTRPDALELRYRLGLLNYDQLVAQRSLAVVVDAHALEKALEQLVEQPQRRAAMGVQGRQRLEQRFSWAVVAGQYRQLWRELAERRRQALATGPKKAQQTLQAPQTRLFGHYATMALPRGPWRRGAQAASVLLEPMQAGTMREWCGQGLPELVHWLQDWPIGDVRHEWAVHQAWSRIGVPESTHPSVLGGLLKLGLLEAN